MKIDYSLVKHYAQYDISFLSIKEREELAKEIDNDFVLNPLCVGIIRANETAFCKWQATFTRSLNQQSIKTILLNESTD